MEWLRRHILLLFLLLILVLLLIIFILLFVLIFIILIIFVLLLIVLVAVSFGKKCVSSAFFDTQRVAGGVSFKKHAQDK